LPDDDYLDKQDILQRLKISGRTLQRWRKQGLIVHTKIGGKIYYSENALKEMMRKGFGGK
jgi:predicted site-specific integrase-resolvase